MKKMLFALLILACLLSAAAENFSGEGIVVSMSEVTEYASTGGTIKEVLIRPGQKVSAGDIVATLETERVYMPWDGEIALVAVSAGETISGDTDAISYTYKEKYLLKGSMDYAYREQNKTICMGMQVYLACSTDNSHVGRGVVIDVSDSDFDVLTVAGDFYPGEVVNVYPDQEKNYFECMGAATVYRPDGGTVKADGYVTRVFVSAGHRADKGEALFELAPGAESDRLIAARDGIVTSVSVSPGDEIKSGCEVFSVYPETELCVRFTVTETDIGLLKEGMTGTAVRKNDAAETQLTVTAASILSVLEKESLTVYAVFDTVPEDLRTGETVLLNIESLRQEP